MQSQPYPSISSQQKPAPKTNADGSIDIYFATTAGWRAKGELGQDFADQGFFVYMRYYGPLKAFNNKTWVPNDVELAK